MHKDQVTSERGGLSPYRAFEPWLLLYYYSCLHQSYSEELGALGVTRCKEDTWKPYVLLHGVRPTVLFYIQCIQGQTCGINISTQDFCTQINRFSPSGKFVYHVL
jgi:hypothetical protein